MSPGDLVTLESTDYTRAFYPDRVEKVGMITRFRTEKTVFGEPLRVFEVLMGGELLLFEPSILKPI